MSMIINVIGECDKRPFVYSLMKFCQNLGDVLFISNNTYYLRLSDTKESLGAYQNTMIAVTELGEDIYDYLDEFPHDLRAFEYVIIDNLLYADANAVVYCKGLEESEQEQDMLEYLEDYAVVEMFKNKNVEPNTLVKCEQFEALRDMSVVSMKMVEKVATLMSGLIGTTTKKAQGIAVTEAVPTKTKGNKKPDRKSAAPPDKKQKIARSGGGGPRVL